MAAPDATPATTIFTAMTALAERTFSTRPERLRSIVRFAFCKRDEVLDDAGARLAAWASERTAA